MKPLLDRERAQAANELHPRDRADVVAQHGANLLLLAFAVEDALHSRSVVVEVSLQGVFEPLPLLIRFEWVPFALVLVEVLQDLVQKSATLHRDRTRFL